MNDHHLKITNVLLHGPAGGSGAFVVNIKSSICQFIEIHSEISV